MGLERGALDLAYVGVGFGGDFEYRGGRFGVLGWGEIEVGRDCWGGALRDVGVDEVLAGVLSSCQIRLWSADCCIELLDAECVISFSLPLLT